VTSCYSLIGPFPAHDSNPQAIREFEYEIHLERSADLSHF
jgi:hypothetical protein